MLNVYFLKIFRSTKFDKFEEKWASFINKIFVFLQRIFSLRNQNVPDKMMFDKDYYYYYYYYYYFYIKIYTGWFISRMIH